MLDPRSLSSVPDRKREPPSFARIYREYAPRVLRWAARLAGPDVESEDVVQEVFWVVSRKLDAFREEKQLLSWIFQITRKIAANHRRRARWRRLWAGSDSLANLATAEVGPDAALERRRLVVLFQRALDHLNEKQRTVFVLYELEGHSALAIAELTRQNHSTVKVQLSRARDRFIAAYQKLLRQECNEVGTGLAQLARKVVDQNASPITRWGKKTV